MIRSTERIIVHPLNTLDHRTQNVEGTSDATYLKSPFKLTLARRRWVRALGEGGFAPRPPPLTLTLTPPPGLFQLKLPGTDKLTWTSSSWRSLYRLNEIIRLGLGVLGPSTA